MKRMKAWSRMRAKSSKRYRVSADIVEGVIARIEKLGVRQDEIAEIIRDLKKDDARAARVEIEKKLFKSAWGNLLFAQELCKKGPTAEDAQSVLRRMSYLADICSRLLSCDSVKPISPTAGQSFDASVHRALGTTQAGPDDLPGTVAECLDVGFIDSGLATPAEVVVFAENK